MSGLVANAAPSFRPDNDKLLDKPIGFADARSTVLISAVATHVPAAGRRRSKKNISD